MQERHTVEKSPAVTQNREISWLHFNQRVLEEGEDKSLPALERLKFLSIFSSNLDEFFMVRVGSLFDLQKACPEDWDRRSGMTPAQQLQAIYDFSPKLMEKKKRIYGELTGTLFGEGIADLSYGELFPSEQKRVKQFYKSHILPILSPIILGSHHPVPHLENKGLYIAARLFDCQDNSNLGLIPIPNSLPPYLALTEGDNLRYIRTENIILHWVYKLFGSYTPQEYTVISVTRNADLSFDDDKFEDIAFDFRKRVTSLLKNRDYLNIVRLEIGRPISREFQHQLCRLVHIDERQMYLDSCPLKMGYVFGLSDHLSQRVRERLLYPEYKPRWPEDLLPGESIISQIQKKDRLLFFPFDSAEPFLRLLSEAAERKDVISIKITIYRLASSSKIVRALCRAAENGKSVMVMMELRARFDEANNIAWSKMLENAGCQVIYGFADFKCHSKICQIAMQNKSGLRYITQVGTGNYNEKTNKMYTDLSLMTASQAIGEDATAFFQNLLINNVQGEYHHLLVSPEGIETTVCGLIDEQIKKGREGYVCVKINSLTDPHIMQKLLEASQAGVDVQMIIRGICCLLPEVPELTENIHITSIVGRFLEHARIYAFGRGQECQIYLSSADFMDRNLHHRVEIACPVYDQELKEKLHYILSVELRDNVKASSVASSGLYERKQPGIIGPVDSQQQFMENTIHASTGLLPKKKALSNRLSDYFGKISQWLREKGV